MSAVTVAPDKSGGALNAQASESLQWLCEAIASQMHMPDERVAAHSLLVDDLGMDSLEMHTLLLTIDDVLGVMPGRRELSSVRTVADLHAAVMRVANAAARVQKSA